MKKTILIILYVLFIPHWGHSQLSTWSEIYLLTYAPGNEIYSIFGHSALRVRDPINNIDLVYNYGTFDFNTNYFVLKFIRGNLKYQLSRTTYEATMQQMIFENRSVYEQQLNLNDEQKQALFDRLEKAYLPENRYYIYRFFTQNCATLIRDDMTNILNDDSLFYKKTSYHTYRQYVHKYTQSKPWLKAGIDILLNKKADEACTAYQTMFLPEYLSKEIRSATIPWNGQTIAQLSERPIEILESSQKKDNAFFQPYMMFSLLLVAFLGINISTGIHPYIKIRSRQLIFGFLSFLALLVLFVSTISLHPQLRGNLNLIWLLPSMGYFIFHFRKNSSWKKIDKIYYWSYLSIILLMLLFHKVLELYLQPDIIPLYLTVIATCLMEIFLPVKKIV